MGAFSSEDLRKANQIEVSGSLWQKCEARLSIWIPGRFVNAGVLSQSAYTCVLSHLSLELSCKLKISETYSRYFLSPSYLILKPVLSLERVYASRSFGVPSNSFELKAFVFHFQVINFSIIWSVKMEQCHCLCDNLQISIKLFSLSLY